MKCAFQTVGDKVIDRTDHVFYRRGRGWKCVLCGGVSANPPPYPTPPTWVPQKIEAVTEEERGYCPFPGPVEHAGGS